MGKPRLANEHSSRHCSFQFSMPMYASDYYFCMCFLTEGEGKQLFWIMNEGTDCRAAPGKCPANRPACLPAPLPALTGCQRAINPFHPHAAAIAIAGRSSLRSFPEIRNGLYLGSVSRSRRLHVRVRVRLEEEEGKLRL